MYWTEIAADNRVSVAPVCWKMKWRNPHTYMSASCHKCLIHVLCLSRKVCFTNPRGCLSTLDCQTALGRRIFKWLRSAQTSTIGTKRSSIRSPNSTGFRTMLHYTGRAWRHNFVPRVKAEALWCFWALTMCLKVHYLRINSDKEQVTRPTPWTANRDCNNQLQRVTFLLQVTVTRTLRYLSAFYGTRMFITTYITARLRAESGIR
jgi:hypothetical protein